MVVAVSRRVAAVWVALLAIVAESVAVAAIGLVVVVAVAE